MNIIVLLPWILLILFFWLVISQIIMPTLRGKQSFPLFRRESRLLGALSRKQQEKSEEELVKKLIE